MKNFTNELKNNNLLDKKPLLSDKHKAIAKANPKLKLSITPLKIDVKNDLSKTSKKQENTLIIVNIINYKRNKKLFNRF